MSKMCEAIIIITIVVNISITTIVNIFNIIN